MHATTNSLGILLCFSLSGCVLDPFSSSRLSTHSPVTYSKPSAENFQKIKIERVSLAGEQLRRLESLPRTKTRVGLRWFVEQRPDTTRPGPWTTRLFIFDGSNSPHCVRVELSDHASYDVQYAWLNEKLLFIQVWWGRIISTDFLLDVETLKIAYAEDANYFRSVYSQEENQR